MLGHFLGVFCKRRSFTRRQVIHPDPIAFYADFLQKFMDVIDTFPAPKISLIVMTVALRATDTKDTIGTFLKTFEQVHYINFAGTGDTENFNICGVCQSHRTCQVRGGIPSVVTTKCYNIRCEFSHYIPHTRRVSISHVIWSSS